jgi:hypothetical protein
MSTFQIVMLVVLVVLGAAYFMRRKSRLSKED